MQSSLSLSRSDVDTLESTRDTMSLITFSISGSAGTCSSSDKSATTASAGHNSVITEPARNWMGAPETFITLIETSLGRFGNSVRGRYTPCLNSFASVIHKEVDSGIVRPNLLNSTLALTLYSQ